MKSEEFATALEGGKTMLRKGVRLLLFAVLFTLHSSLFTSCSEDDATEEEFVNWQVRNDQFFADLEGKYQADKVHWRKLKSITKDEHAEGKASDYIYAYIAEPQTNGDTLSPAATDSVLVMYQGRLIPSKSYAEGMVFDGTAQGTYDVKTNAAVKFVVSGLTTGFATALQYMHKGDTWRIYVPSDLGYGDAGNSTIPGHSVLIFDITLIGFCHAGESLPEWS
jgi:FKBP-type peptidyl-prolyl cis-trans isomerase FklB